MSIPNTIEKGKGHRLFIAGLVILIALSMFGLWKLYAVQTSDMPVTLEQTALVTLATQAVTAETKSAEASSAAGKFVASKTGKAYYLPWCPAAKRIKDSNKVWFASEDAAKQAGYAPAKNCKGL